MALFLSKIKHLWPFSVSSWFWKIKNKTQKMGIENGDFLIDIYENQTNWVTAYDNNLNLSINLLVQNILPYLLSTVQSLLSQPCPNSEVCTSYNFKTLIICCTNNYNTYISQ